MEIAFCLDNNYLMPCGVAMCSICENNKNENVNFHIITTGFSAQNRESLKKIADKYSKDIHFYQINLSQLDKFPVFEKGQPKNVTLAAYIRIFLCEVLPTSMEKVLYLDCDLIVTENLSELWNTNIENCSGAAVPDYDTDDIRHYNRMKYTPEFKYCNSGVLLLNLKYWRENKIFPKLIDYFQKHRERIRYHDQDIINGVLHKDLKKIDAKFNVQLSYWAKDNYNFCSYQRWDELANARKKPVIIHYISTMKPWHKECYYTVQSHFLKYKKLTEWKDQPLTYLYPLKVRIKRRIRHILEDLHLMQRKEECYDRHYDSFRKKHHLR